MKPTTIDEHELLERKEELLRRRLLHTIEALRDRGAGLGDGQVTADAKVLIPLLASAGVAALLWSAGHGVARGVRRWRRRRRWRRLLRI